MIVLFIIHVLIHVLKSFHAHEFGWTAANQNWALPLKNNTNSLIFSPDLLQSLYSKYIL